MRDWRSGPQWDSRTLEELDGYRIKAVCQTCRHTAYFDPEQLRRRQHRDRIWIAIAPRLKCNVCKKKIARLTLEPAPRVRIKKIPRRSNIMH